MQKLLQSRLAKTLCFAIASIAIFVLTTPYMTAASISYFLLLTGIFFCNSRKTHSCFMSTGVAIDIGLVLFLECTRSAIAEAISAPLTIYQRGHIICSLLAVVLYIPTLALGLKAMNSGERKRNFHRQFGIAAFAFRSIGFLLMFSLLSKVQAKP